MKNTFKKIVMLLLVCAMAFSLCACGSTSDTSASGASSASSAEKPAESAAPAAEKTAAADASAAPEYVYKPVFTKVTGDEKVSYFTPAYLLPDGSGFYATGSEIVGYKAPEDAVPQYYGQFDVTEPALYFVGKDGSVKLLENYEPMPAPEAEEGMYGFQASSYISALCVTENGLSTIEFVYRSWSDSEDLDYADEDFYDHYHYDESVYIRSLDLTGKELSCGKIEHSPMDYLYCNKTMDKAGNFIFTKNTESGEYSIAAYTAAGELAYEVPCEDSINVTVSSFDGEVYASVWGNTGMSLIKLDQENKTFGEPVSIPGDAYNIIPGGGDYPFYYTSGVSFYGFDPDSGEEPVKLLNWLDCDVDPDEMYQVLIDENGVIHGMLNNFDSYSLSYDRQLVDIQKVPYDPSAEKKELTLATQYLSWELRNAVTAFNRKSDDVRIVVKDYSEYNTEEDYSAGLTKLQTEIMAGNCPDIIDMSGLSIAQLSAKGILEDLYPYMEKDPEIKKDAFLPNVLAAAESDGKLMHTFSWFNLNTVVGASMIVGDEPGWTYDDLYNALRDMPDECTPFDVSTTRDEILNTCLNLDMADFVNWSTGEVNFDNEEFVDLLKFAESFPENYDWETYDWENDNPEARIREGRQMLYQTTLSSLDNLMYIEASYNGTPVTFIGYPTNNGTGNTLALDSGYAMSFSCSDKDAAWSFLRQFFTESYYENYGYYGLPVQKELLEKKLNKVCTITYKINNDGEYELDANGEKIPEEHYYAMGDMANTYYCLSEEMAAKFMDLVDTTSRVSLTDQSIKDIVTKQSAAFFSGQKSAEEAAKLVQSNAKIYVNEQR
ncbi:MAG: extracellular solute-binding protein [Eubacteriales bacterium]|nr:extracellular solute-binding protein [Eubacteriales bacterium]